MSYHFPTCITDTSQVKQDMIETCEEELTEITEKIESTENNGENIYNWTMRIQVLTERLRKLKEDLSRKQKEEMTSKRTKISEKLARMKILFDT